MTQISDVNATHGTGYDPHRGAEPTTFVRTKRGGFVCWLNGHIADGTIINEHGRRYRLNVETER